jgi:hypothetical protein
VSCAALELVLRTGIYGFEFSPAADAGAMVMTPGTAACNRADLERFLQLVVEPSDVNAVSG